VTRVTICVATYRRPLGLDRLLESLAALELEGGDGEAVHMRIVVVDNDPRASAREVVERLRGRLPNLTYVVEPDRGISRVRNRLFGLALEDPSPDYVAVVDDDEWVEPTWLRSFICCAAHMRCVLIGPVLPAYDECIPAWIRGGRFFERGRAAAGGDVIHANAGNLFVPHSVMLSLGTASPFGEIFERPGGEDTYFSALVRRSGHAIRWCEDARAYEEVSCERGSVRWLVKRAYEGGYDFSRVVRLTRSSRRELVLRGISGIGHVVVGALLLLPALLHGRAALLRAARRLTAGVGALVGLFEPLPTAHEPGDQVGVR
jgi:glycosyltransferase involved in cell wall biosynthesis